MGRPKQILGPGTTGTGTGTGNGDGVVQMGPGRVGWAPWHLADLAGQAVPAKTQYLPAKVGILDVFIGLRNLVPQIWPPGVLVS